MNMIKVIFYNILSFNIFICFLLTSCNGISNDVVVYDYHLHWEVESNFIDQNRFRSQLKLVNESRTVLEDDWTLYFNFMRLIDTESVSSQVRLTHINGDFYKLNPTREFESLQPGEGLEFSFEASGSVITEFEAPAGAYFEFSGEDIVPVNVVVKPFVRDEQLNRHPDDAVPVSSPDIVYKRNSQLYKLEPEKIVNIVPTPVKIENGEGSLTITGETLIYYQEGLECEARFLSDSFAQYLDAQPQIIKRDGSIEDTGIQLKIGDIEIDGAIKQYGEEAYTLKITGEGIEIKGSDAAGVFYGIQSLRLLFPLDVWQSTGSIITVGAVTITDVPGLTYRGLHLDVSRNFQSVETVKRLLDVMSLYKLNKFHFHLTDDEGWRLEINAFPELTEVGGRRGHTHDESDNLMPSLGSGPYPDASMGSGWYTQEEFKEILRYANERHIEVIPEIDVPGHARAALVSMNARYKRLLDENEIEEANRYRIHDPNDESKYMSVQRWNDNVINVCQESTYRFLDVIFDELIDMYREAGAPLTTIHVGGDEVPFGAWRDSPVCKQFITESDEVNSANDLMNYFFTKMENSLSKRGLVMSAWGEFLLVRDPETGRRKANPIFAGRSIPYVWWNIWGGGTEGFSYKFANAGYEIVMSHASNFYFDLVYNKHPEEIGLYWAGFVDTRDPFAFIPFDLYKSGMKDRMGRVIPEDAYDDFEKLTDKGRKNILGLQGQLWSETFRSPERVEYMALPRIIPLAERAWVPHRDWMEIVSRSERLEAFESAWNEFANRLGQRELRRLDSINGGYEYRIPPPGAIIENNKLKANVAYPGLEIRYTTNGGEPTVDSSLYVEPVILNGNKVIKLRTFDTRGRGSRVVTLGTDKIF